MSKQDSKQNLKVKFGGVIEETKPNAFNKKKKMKGRSPSILKNGKNVLNSSVISVDVNINLFRNLDLAQLLLVKIEEKNKNTKANTTLIILSNKSTNQFSINYKQSIMEKV